MQILFKKLDPRATTPTKKRETDAGIDIYALEETVIFSQKTTKVKSGIAACIPPGYVGVLKGRSGMGAMGIDVYGGVIDEEYRGDITAILYNSSVEEHYVVQAGDKMCQMLIIKREDIDIVDVGDDPLPESDRGEAGFGSSGR